MNLKDDPMDNMINKNIEDKDFNPFQFNINETLNFTTSNDVKFRKLVSQENKYFDLQALSQSQINDFIVSEGCFWNRSVYNKDKTNDNKLNDNMIIGKILHYLLFTHLNLQDIVKVYDFGKSRINKKYTDIQDNGDPRIIINHNELETIKNIYREFCNHKNNDIKFSSFDIFHENKSFYINEKELFVSRQLYSPFYTQPIDININLKAKLDYIIQREDDKEETIIIYDYKTINSIYKIPQKTFLRYGYQGIFYINMLYTYLRNKGYTNIPEIRFILVFQSKASTENYQVIYREYTLETLETLNNNIMIIIKQIEEFIKNPLPTIQKYSILQYIYIKNYYIDDMTFNKDVIE